ncbi:MAG: nucleoside recognition protein [Cyanobacteria bacterium SIG27]|nr:nucleoside recognition protein [Cyanobacteria bacterium SIG27]
MAKVISLKNSKDKMNYIFIFLLLISFICAIFNGTMSDTINGILKSSQKAVEISFSLIGIMAFWLGIVNIAKNSGLVELFSKLIKKPLLKIFPDLKENNNAISNIALNISANALGLMNAATPFGIKAMEDMQGKNEKKDQATNSMCTFLAINTAGFQIVPAVVIAILSANGMQNPTQIIIPTLIVTSIAFISALFFSKILERVFK